MFLMPGSKSGRCTNYSGCKLAYRNEQITVVTKDFRCPECGSPLEPYDYGRQRVGLRFLTIGVVAVLLFAVAAIIWTLFFSVKPPIPPPSVEVAATVTPTPTPEPIETPIARVEPSATPIDVATPLQSPAATHESISLDPEIHDVNAVREEARKRILRIPKIPDGTRDWLLQALEHAHGVGRLFEVTFEPSSFKLTAEDMSYLRSEVETDQIKKLLNEQALGLFVLGFADKQGADERNLALSKERAEVVASVLRSQCGVRNVIQTVPMGGTNIHDLHDYARNRVVEVWATLP
jgi:outer membrane protein OmpA-like peptidoglycan-associated protein